MTDSKTVAVLVSARAVLERHYVPRYPNRELGEHCSVTALYEVCPEDFDSRRAARKLVMKVAGVIYGDEFTAWSDAGPKSKVLKGFSRAIELARREECK